MAILGMLLPLSLEIYNAHPADIIHFESPEQMEDNSGDCCSLEVGSGPHLQHQQDHLALDDQLHEEAPILHSSCCFTLAIFFM